MDTGDTAWILASSALVLLMTPGLAYFYGGLVKAKSVVSMMMLSFGALALISVLWVLYGYAMSFSNAGTGNFIGIDGIIGIDTDMLGLSSLLEVPEGAAFPPLAFALYVASPWALYFSSWYDASLSSAYVHEMMHVHLVLVGTLFFWPLMGVDPVPGRVGYPFRVLLTIMTLPFHAFLGVTIMGQQELLGGDWYPSLHDGPMGVWLPDPLADQHLAGGILWGSGDLIGLGFFAVLFAQWVRDSMREAKREDRRLDLLEARSAAARPGDDRGAGTGR